MLDGLALKKILGKLNSTDHGYDDNTVAASLSTLKIVLEHVKFEPIDITEELWDYLGQMDDIAQHTIIAGLELQALVSEARGRNAASGNKKR